MIARFDWFRKAAASTHQLWAAVDSIAPKIGCVPQTLLEWVKRSEIDAGQRDGLNTDERNRLKQLERENKELRRASEILKTGPRVFCPGGARPPIETVKRYIDQRRDDYGVEPICKAVADCSVVLLASRRAPAPSGTA